MVAVDLPHLNGYLIFDIIKDVISTVTILYLGTMNHDTQQVAHRIDQNVPLASLDFFSLRQIRVHLRLRSSSPFGYQSFQLSAVDFVHLVHGLTHAERY